jgi:hypothetical protein
MGGAPTLGWGLGGRGAGSHSRHAKRGCRLEPATLSDRAARHDGQPPKPPGRGAAERGLSQVALTGPSVKPRPLLFTRPLPV